VEIYCFLYPHGKPFHIPVSLTLEEEDELEFRNDEHVISSCRDISDGSDCSSGRDMDGTSLNENAIL
jgi:hypothetical protein